MNVLRIKTKESSSMDEIRARRERVERVQELFRDVNYKTDEDRVEAITSFVKSAMTLKEVEFIANTLKPEYLSTKDASTHSQVRKVGVY